MNAFALDYHTRTTPPGRYGNASAGQLTQEETERRALEGLWRSQGGSLYVCDGQALICLSVHSAEFRGWIGKVAVRDLHCTDGIWRGWQAFRNKLSGALTDWHPVTLDITENRITKYFPGGPSAGILVYGHVEHYYRVNLQ